MLRLRHDVTYRTRSEIDNVLNAIETRDNPDANAEVPAVEKPAPPAAAVQTATATAVSTPSAGGGGGTNKRLLLIGAPRLRSSRRSRWRWY
jgi:hypothetical protein